MTKAELYLSWRAFKMQLVLAVNYNLQCDFDGPCRFRKNPIIEALVPNILFIKLLSIYDHLLNFVIKESKIQIDYKKESWRKAVSDSGKIKDYGQIRGLIKKRQDIAHDTKEMLKWNYLKRAVNLVEEEFLFNQIMLKRVEFKLGTNCYPHKATRNGVAVDVDHFEIYLKEDESSSTPDFVLCREFPRTKAEGTPRNGQRSC